MSRNLGLITGASAMGAIYVMGPRIAEILGFVVDSSDGLRITFAVATCLAGLSVTAALWSQRRG